MNTETIHPCYTPMIYDELTVGKADFIDLAERCELLSQIVLDAHASESITPVLRCLAAYLDKLAVSLDEDMSEQRISELTTDKEITEGRHWIFADTDLQCTYCQALTALLMRNVCSNVCSAGEREALTGLLHDLIGALVFELKEPRFAAIAH